MAWVGAGTVDFINSDVNTMTELAWEIMDTLNGLMAIPNLIALAFLSPVVFELTREYFGKIKAKK